MCGISVVFNKNKLNREVYNDFIDSLRKINHRGPDDEGVVLINTTTNDYRIIHTELNRSNVDNQVDVSSVDLENYNLILGHKRLSIIDLSTYGHQPMLGNDGSWIVFNGEIYNYLEIRDELKHLGCHFKTDSDTEVILEAYRVWGNLCLNKFNGMWSICIWDAPNKNIFISNDRFGVKPFYYHEQEDGFIFVSETKQFKCFRKIQLKINDTHLNEFVKFGFIDRDEETMYGNIFRFKKAHFYNSNIQDYKKKDIHLGQTRFYTINRVTISISEKEAIEQFRALLYDAVKIRMRADVNFGFALSGGLDSSAILYAARNIIQNDKRSNDLLGFAAIFPGYEAADESKFVKIVAGDLPCKTNYSRPMDEFNPDAFESHIYTQDEPLMGTTYFAQWCVYKKAAEAGVKILFNGQGADEVFAGYHHHFYRYCRQLLIQGKVLKYFELVRQFSELKDVSKKQIHHIVINELKLKAKIKLGIAKFDHSLVKYWNKIDTLDEMLWGDFDSFQLPNYLRVDDRNSMAFSMESRHPFMDYRLVEFGYSLPNTLRIKNGWQKYIIREAMTEMPESIRFRKDKKGFTTPEKSWLEKNKERFDEYLSYNEKFIGERTPSHNAMANYGIGAWLKVNGPQ